MNQAEIVAFIGQWLENNEYQVEGDLGSQKLTDVIDSSLDVVELTMDLEEAIGAGDDEVDLEDQAPKFATLTVDQLAAEIVKLDRGRGP